jgi:Metallo-beta-lactamase superfamily
LLLRRRTEIGWTAFVDDTMIAGSAGRIIARAEATGVPIVRIALTHAHGDHVGSLDALKERVPSAEVIISSRDARPLAKDMSLNPDEPRDKLRGGYPGTRTKPDRTVEPGDRVGSLEVIAAPGHTPGHVAYLDHRDRTLYCGDVYSTLGGVATSAKLNLRCPIALFTWHRPTELSHGLAVKALRDRLLAGFIVEVRHPASALQARDRGCRLRCRTSACSLGHAHSAEHLAVPVTRSYRADRSGPATPPVSSVVVPVVVVPVVVPVIVVVIVDERLPVGDEVQRGAVVVGEVHLAAAVSTHREDVAAAVPAYEGDPSPVR